MIAGIVLLALGVEQVLEYVAESALHRLSDPLRPLPVVALYGGVATFLVAHVAFKWRTWHRLTVRRLVVAGVLLAAIPLGAAVPALGALAFVAMVMTVMIASEAVRYAEERERIRHDQPDTFGAVPD
jgi:membrane protein YdbS with pleckstrin-like domain